MKAELTAENRPAYLPRTSVRPTVTQVEAGTETHEDEGGVQVFVILPCVISVKLVGFLAVDGEEVGASITGPQRLEELFEGGAEAKRGARSHEYAGDNHTRRTHHSESSPTTTGSCSLVSL